MTKSITFAVALFALLAATNPKEQDHAREIVANAGRACAQAGDLGKLMCGGAAILATSAGLEYRDHLVYSTGRLGDTDTVGILGRVVVLGGDETRTPDMGG